MGTKRSILIGRIVSTICLLILGAIWIMPLIWALGASFKPDTITDINQIFPSLITGLLNGINCYFPLMVNIQF